MSTDDIDDIYEHLSKYEQLIGVRSPPLRGPAHVRPTPAEYVRKHKKPLVVLPGRESFAFSFKWHYVFILAGIFFAAIGLFVLVGGISTLGTGGNAYAGEVSVACGLTAYSVGLVVLIVSAGTIVKQKAESSVRKNLEEIREQNRIIIELLGKITSELIFGF